MHQKIVISLIGCVLACAYAFAEEPKIPTVLPGKQVEPVIGSLTKWTPSAEPLKVQFPVEKFQLQNGLTVLLHQDRSVPMISYHTWYRVGSRNEGPGITGAAHMLEHMMFKGAKKYSGKDFDRILHENGISNNAFTSYDYTGFYQNLPSSKLELMMDMEVDRMRFLNLKEEDLKSELQVVGEERRMRVDNSPMGLLRETFMGSLFKVHSYSWPIIGYMKDIQSYKIEDLKRFYDTFYVPNNAVLVLSGDFDIPKTKELVQKYYGQLEQRPIPPENIKPEPEVKKSNWLTLEKEIQTASLSIGWKTVSSSSEDTYALELAGAILGQGSASRLYKSLVLDQQLATNVVAYQMSLKDPGVFAVNVFLKNPKDAKKVHRIVLREIEKLKKQDVSENELIIAKASVMTEFVDSLTTNDGKARALAVNEILFSDYSRSLSDLDRYQNVNSTSIKAAVNKWLPSAKSTVVELRPGARK